MVCYSVQRQLRDYETLAVSKNSGGQMKRLPRTTQNPDSQVTRSTGNALDEPFIDVEWADSGERRNTNDSPPADPPTQQRPQETRHQKAWKWIKSNLALSLIIGAIVVWLVSSPSSQPNGNSSTDSNNQSVSVTEKPQIHKIVVRENEPQTVLVPQNHRWDLIGKIPTSGYSTFAKEERDENGNRVQIFEVAGTTKEITLEVKVEKCTSAKMCAW